MASDYDRRQLYVALERQIGEGPAGTLMEMLPPVGWADVATRSDLAALRKELRGEMAEVRGEMAEVRGEMAEVRGEMGEVRGEMGELRGELGELRGEIKQLAGEIKAQLPKLYAANLAGAIATAGLVLAAAKLA